MPTDCDGLIWHFAVGPEDLRMLMYLQTLRTIRIGKWLLGGFYTGADCPFLLDNSSFSSNGSQILRSSSVSSCDITSPPPLNEDGGIPSGPEPWMLEWLHRVLNFLACWRFWWHPMRWCLDVLSPLLDKELLLELFWRFSETSVEEVDQWVTVRTAQAADNQAMLSRHKTHLISSGLRISRNSV